MDWDALQQKIITCQRCPRLREHCERVAREKRAAFRDWTYWGKPVPNLGPADARLLIVGLAPAAHGANRTGRMFTGDRSGDFLFQALYEAGFASQPHATDAGDGLELTDLAITAAAHCAPPANKPTREELANCYDYMRATVEAMPNLRGVIALGGIGFGIALGLYRERSWLPKGPKPKFGHGAFHRWPGAPFLLASYHPSQQNTFTGRLTPAMFRDIFQTARRELDRR